MVRIGTMISFDKSLSFEALERKFALLCDYGMDNCQLCSWDPSAWTDECAEKIRELSVKYGIMSIPSVLLFENGKVVKKSVGFSPKEALIEELGI